MKINRMMIWAVATVAFVSAGIFQLQASYLSAAALSVTESARFATTTAADKINRLVFIFAASISQGSSSLTRRNKRSPLLRFRLAGQLLVFQSAPAERLPQLLKDLGEAFYRWQPKATPGTNPLEEALVQ